MEISYALKVSVSGSLSSEVSVEIPCRIVNFVSIDPPPGHPGPSAFPSNHKAMARAWSTDHLRQVNMDRHNDTSSLQAIHQSARSGVPRMASMDSLNMQDLNKMYSIQHSMSRQHWYGSQQSEGYGYSQGVPMARSFTMPTGLGIIQENRAEINEEAVPQMDTSGAEPNLRRQLRHQMSLDCIGSAIASATARRAGHQRTNSGLSSVYTAETEEDVPPLPYLQEQYNDPQSVQLDDLDEIPDDYENLPVPQPSYLHSAQQVNYNHKDGTPYSYSDHIQLHDTDYAEYEDESEDEVDLVLQAKQYESDDEYPATNPARAPLSPSTTYARRDNTASSPVKSAMKTVPSKSPSAPRRSQTGSNEGAKEDNASSLSRPASALGSSTRMSFGVASPASPVKKSYTPITSPPRRNTRTLAPQSSMAAGRSSRMTPSSPASGMSVRTSSSSASARGTRPAAPGGEAMSTADDGSHSSTNRQQVRRVPGPLSTPSVIRTQPMKGGMRKMASTSVLRSSGM